MVPERGVPVIRTLLVIFPSEVTAEQGVELTIIRGKIVGQTLAHCPIHLSIVGLVVDLQSRRAMSSYTQECLSLMKDPQRLCIEVFTLDDQEPVAGKGLEPAPDLIDVEPAGLVGVVSPSRVHRVITDCKTLRFALDCLLKRQCFQSVPDFHVVLGEGAIDRISQKHEEPGMWHGRQNPFRRLGVEQVEGTCLTNELELAAQREVREIPVDSPIEVPVEVVNFFAK